MLHEFSLGLHAEAGTMMSPSPVRETSVGRAADHFDSARSSLFGRFPPEGAAVVLYIRLCLGLMSFGAFHDVSVFVHIT